MRIPKRINRFQSPGTAAIRLGIAITVALSAVLIGVQTVSAADDSSTVRSFYSANGLLNRGHYAMAVEEYREFLEESPDHEFAPAAAYGLGVSLFRLGHYEDSASVLDDLRDDPDCPYPAETCVIVGQCRLVLGDYLGAAEALKDVIEDHSDHQLADDAAALRAEALYRAGDHQEAVLACRRLTDRWPDSPLRERAELFASLSEMATGEYSAAADRLRGMTKRFPRGEHAEQTSLLLAQCLHRTNSLPAALEQYRKVMQQAGDALLPRAMYGLADVLHKQGQHKAAGETLDRMLKQYPKDELVPAARMLRAHVWFALEEYRQAGEIFADLAATKGEDQDAAAFWAAKCELRRDRAEDAADRLRDAIANFPKSELMPEMMFDYAAALSRQGDDREALDQWTRFRSRFAQHKLAPDALHLAASTLHQLQDYEQSRDLCREFGESYPDHPSARANAFVAAENLFLMKDYDLAAEAYETFTARYPDSPQHEQAQFRLGMALYRLGRFDDAETALARVADSDELEPEFRASLLALGDISFQRGEWENAESRLGQYLTYGMDQSAADDALLKLGLSRHRQGRLEPALESYDVLLERFEASPHRLQAVFERGQALVELDRADEAREAFESVVDEAADSEFVVHSLNHLGAIAFRQGRFDDAAGCFSQVAERVEGDDAAEAAFQWGQSLIAAGDLEQGAEVFGSLMKEHRRSDRVPEAHARRCIALARLGQHESALEEIEEFENDHLASIDSTLQAAVLYEKAWCLRSLNNDVSAKGAYDELLALNPATDLHRHARLELAELEVEAEEYAKAASLLRELLSESGLKETAPDLCEQGMYRLGVCEYRLGRFREAGQELDRFIKSWTGSEYVSSARLLCGEALFKTGSHQRAASHLRRVVDDHKTAQEYGPALLRLGECLAVLQHWARSEEAFATYLRSFPDSDLWFQARFGVGWAKENQSRYDDAVADYRQVVDRHSGPTAARAQFQIGECLFARGEHEDAARELLKVDILYAYPEWSAGALYEAGRCFEAMGKPVEAKQQFERVVSRFDDTQWAHLAAQGLERVATRALPGRSED